MKKSMYLSVLEIAESPYADESVKEQARNLLRMLDKNMDALVASINPPKRHHWWQILLED